MKKVVWINLSERELKALHILSIFNEKGIEKICKEIKFSRGSFFNKIQGKNKFKEAEFIKLLNILEINEEKLREIAQGPLVETLS